MARLIFFLFIALPIELPAQDALYFQKNRRRVALYKIGQTISFRVRGERTRITQQIIGFNDSLIVFRNYQVNPREITHLYVDDKTRKWFLLRYKYEKLFLIAGIGYMTLDLLNTGEIEKETAVISTGLIAAGLLARVIISKKMRINRDRKLVVI